MKYLVVGLGNPGTEYANTRHNVGFMVVDSLAASLDATFSVQRLGAVARAKYRGRQLVLLKPSTFMNLSGRAVAYWLQKEALAVEQLLVVVDDLALPLGAVRLRAKGGAGGHNGLKDIEAHLKGASYARLRVGIDNAFSRGKQVDYVLSAFSSEEQPSLKQAIVRAQEAIGLFVTIGSERAMNRINIKGEGQAPDGKHAD